MKTTLSLFVAGLFSVAAFSQTRADIIIQYKDLTDTENFLIGNTGHAVINPTDLEFHPDLSKNELWVLSKGSANGGHVSIFSDAGLPTQTEQNKSDEFKEIYMASATGIAFGENDNFATCSGTFDAHADGGDPFTGPTLWSSDLAVFAEPGLGAGSHLDDLHQSPYGQGIAWEAQNIYWVYDGYNQDLVRYDFQSDHGPGGNDESDGLVYRYGGLDLAKDPDDEIISHIAKDPASNWLYVVDHGNQRVLRLDVTSGTPAGTPFFGPFEPLADYRDMVDHDWEVVISDTSIVSMSGIALINNKLLLADHETGAIIVYQTDGPFAFQEWFRIETGDPGIQGIEIGPDGRIFYVNEANNKCRRIDSPSLSLKEIEKTVYLKLYPNPTTENLNIQADVNILASELSLFAQSGQKMDVNVEQIDKNNLKVETSELSSGIYFVNLVGDYGTISKRFIAK